MDTSVIGGYHDLEFEEETHILFEKIKLGQYDVIISNVTEDELADAPKKVKSVLSIIEKHITKVKLTTEAIELANNYLAENVVGKTSLADCYHIALATIHNADILVSWNFKHIVNVKRIRGYNAVNIKSGYNTLDIRSPKDLIYDEEE